MVFHENFIFESFQISIICLKSIMPIIFFQFMGCFLKRVSTRGLNIPLKKQED